MGVSGVDLRRSSTEKMVRVLASSRIKERKEQAKVRCCERLAVVGDGVIGRQRPGAFFRAPSPDKALGSSRDNDLPTTQLRPCEGSKV